MSIVRLIIAAVLLIVISGYTTAKSLYDETTYRPYATDAKAFMVGDAITVNVVEMSSAESSADTVAHRGFGGDAYIQDFGGLDVGDIKVGTETGGGGKVKRKGDLRAQITVEVKKILPNGILVISGEKIITVNDEEQRIVVTGKVRSDDISSDNIVLSSRISDAHIEYMGKGVIGDSQKPGAIYRFFNWIGII